jgi:hypothetical protein
MNDNNIPAAKKRPLLKKIDLFIRRFLFVISRKEIRDDIIIATFFRDRKSMIVFSKINQALNLISEFDPRRYRQIKRDVRKIWLFIAKPAAGCWINELQTCVLDKEFYCGLTPASRMALTIVHEATHARLHKFKIKYTEDIRDRVERICIKSEIAFAKRLPDGKDLIKMAESKLKRPKSFYTDSQHQQRNLDALGELRKKTLLARILYPILKRKLEKKNSRLISREKD